MQWHRLGVWTAALYLAASVAGQQPAMRARSAYRSACLDRARRSAQGTQPLTPYFNEIQSLVTTAQVAGPLGRLHRFGIAAGFRLDGSPASPHPPQTDNQHRRRLAQLFQRAGDPPEAARQEARDAVQLAHALLGSAPVSTPIRPQWLGFSQLRRLAPNLNWTAYYAGLGVVIGHRLPIADPATLHAVNGSLLTAPLQRWKSYLRSRWLEATADLLSPAASSTSPLTRGCAAAEAAFPLAAFAQVPIPPDDFFQATLRLRAWRVRRMLESNSPAASPGGR